MTNKKKITMKYWDSLEPSSRFRVLRKILSNFPDSVNHDYAKMKAKDLDFVWTLIQRHVKMPVGECHYRTCIHNCWLM